MAMIHGKQENKQSSKNKKKVVVMKVSHSELVRLRRAKPPANGINLAL